MNISNKKVTAILVNYISTTAIGTVQIFIRRNCNRVATCVSDGAGTVLDSEQLLLFNWWSRVCKDQTKLSEPLVIQIQCYNNTHLHFEYKQVKRLLILLGKQTIMCLRESRSTVVR